MYEILNYTFDEACAQVDHAIAIVKPVQKVIEYVTNDLATFCNESSILIFYDIISGVPLILVERVPISIAKSLRNVRNVLRECTVDNFVVVVSKSGNGKHIDITLISKNIYEIVSTR